MLRYPSLRRPLDILFLICCIALTADVLVPEIWGNGKTKDYPLWFWAGQQVLQGKNLYPSDPAAYFEFIYPPLSAVLLAIPSWFGKIPLYLVLSLLNATLTLPGIAGIVLTVGITVDSNVLIYERIREEVRGGRTPINAIDAGFTRALATILDSNITTFIAAAVLFYIGTGPVRGFAVTLGIGIITTVFTAFTLTRLIVAYWVRWRRPQRVPI